MCYGYFYLSLCTVMIAGKANACNNNADAVGRLDTFEEKDFKPDSAKDYGSTIKDEKEALDQYIPVVEETIKLGYPNGKTLTTSAIVFKWNLGDLAGKVKQVELHGRNKAGVPLFCNRWCRIVSDCTKCKLKDLAHGKYDWYIVATGYDGFKHKSEPGRFTILPSALNIAEIVPEFFHTNWALKPNTDNDKYAAGTVVKFSWDLGIMLNKMKEIKFVVAKRDGPTVFSITLVCGKDDCTGLLLKVIEDGKYDWIIEAAGKDGSKHKSIVGHFQTLPAHLVKEPKKSSADELDNLAEDIATNTHY